ncbi:MAG: RNA 2',3'-cyclic phosphodiesterase [Terriglobales bacterium]
MRLFIALDIDDAIRERIGRFVEGVRGFAPEARWVRLESVHVTLKFIGEKPPEFVTSLHEALSAIRVPPFAIVFRNFGFFPTARSPRVFWAGIQAGPDLQKLAATVDAATAGLGVPQEEHPFSAHLTLARKSGSSGAPRRQKGDGPNQAFQRLQEKLAAMPPLEFGTMTAREFFLYQSQLSRNGSRYTRLQSFPFQGDTAAPGSDAPHNP